MPRDGSGNYTLPAGNPVVDGTIIETTWANPTLNDIALQLNNVVTRDGLLGPTTPLKFTDGTVALPGIAWNTEASTGFYHPSAGIMAVSVLGSKVGQWSANGYSSPDGISLLMEGPTGSFYSAAEEAVTIVDPEGAIVWRGPLEEPPGAVLQRTTGDILVMRGLGGLSLETTAGGIQLFSGVFAPQIDAGIDLGSTAFTWDNVFAVKGIFGSGGPFFGAALDIETSDGTPQIGLKNTGAVHTYVLSLGSSGNLDLINSSGTGVYLTLAGGGWTTISDERVKTGLQPIEHALDKVDTLRSVTGYYTRDPDKHSRAFLIAQDVQAVLPQAVQSGSDGMLGVSYTEVVPLLVAAIKELNAKVEAL